MTDRDRLIIEEPEKMCESCCNFDKEHIRMDGFANCKLTMTLAYAEDNGGNCMFYNVPKEQIIIPPCKVGDTVYFLARSLHTQIEKVKSGKVLRIAITENGFDLFVNNHTAKLPYGKRAFLAKEEAEQALAERSGDNA